MTLQLRYTVVGQEEQVVPVVNPPIILGTLLSNQVVLRAPGVDPIHALIEEHQGQFMITDLGSGMGVSLNGQRIDVETSLKPGDRISIGKVEILVEAYTEAVEKVIPPPVPQLGSVSLAEGTPPKSIPTPNFQDESGDELPAISLSTEASKDSAASFVRYHTDDEDMQKTVRQEARTSSSERRKEKKELLFSPRKARPSGDVLEVVAYWDDIVLDVDLFHPTFKDFDKVTLGDSEKSHFLAAGPGDLKEHILANVSEGGYKIRLTEGMEARMRRGGKVETQTGPGSHKMGSRDIAHIKFGPVRYFLLFIKPPSIRLPRSGPRDPIFATLILVAALLYLAVIPALWLGDPKKMESESTDVWKLVSVPTKNERPKPRPEPKVEKPKVEVAEKEPEQKKPPTPPEVKQPPQPVTKPEQVTETKPPKVTQPQNKPQVPATKNLASNANDSQANNDQPNPNNSRRAGPAGSKDGAQGMPQAGNKPDFKRPGPVTANKTNPRSGGPRGSGNNSPGGEIKGQSAVSVKGVEGPQNNRASGVNLSKLGLGAGRVLNNSGPGAIRSNFRNAAGGAGGGSGSGSRTYGLGGPGKSGSLGLSGSGGAVNNFGSGSGGLGSGQGGSGGRGGDGLSGVGYGRDGSGEGGGGRGRPNISIPASDAVVGGGLTRNEIMAVIRANLNQIRACYEQLLQRSPNASGKLQVQFVINAAGRVSSVSRIGGNLTDSLMSSCVTGKIQRWNFPKPRGASSVEVKYPFGFTPL